MAAARRLRGGGGGYGGDPGRDPAGVGPVLRHRSGRSSTSSTGRGTQGKVEAASQGKKLPPSDKADVDRYNSLLNQYLGARCHV